MRILNLKLQNQHYDIIIEKGILKDIGSQLEKVLDDKRVVLLTDYNVDNLYGKMVIEGLKEAGFDVDKIVIKPGEESKFTDTLFEIYSKLAHYKVSRTTTLIALGGGVVGDIGGFAASTFLRGIPFVQIPTTLLAQVDSSIGGKVAVNLPEGKNLVGSFYHPKAVFIDPEVLNTLDSRVFNDGMSEVIKYGGIRDGELFYKLLNYKNIEELKNNLEEIIYTCCSIKKAIVEVDERDNGERMLLNFGHTFGHAIEKYFDYKKYTHGEAVAIGMNLITEIGEKEGITEVGTNKLIKEILIKYNLPLSVDGLDMERLIDIIKLDKKNMGDSLNFIMLKRVGDGVIYKVGRDRVGSTLTPSL